MRNTASIVWHQYFYCITLARYVLPLHEYLTSQVSPGSSSYFQFDIEMMPFVYGNLSVKHKTLHNGEKQLVFKTAVCSKYM